VPSIALRRLNVYSSKDKPFLAFAIAQQDCVTRIVYRNTVFSKPWCEETNPKAEESGPNLDDPNKKLPSATNELARKPARPTK
jgi:hypothetical protein